MTMMTTIVIIVALLLSSSTTSTAFLISSSSTAILRMPLRRCYTMKRLFGYTFQQRCRIPSTKTFHQNNSIFVPLLHTKPSTVFHQLRMTSMVDNNEDTVSNNMVVNNEIFASSGGNTEAKEISLVDQGNDIDNENDDSNTQTEDSPILYQSIQYSITKALKGLTKKQKSLEKESEKAKSLEQMYKRANLIISNLYRLPIGTESIIVEDWDDGSEIELKLDTKKYASAKDESDALFTAARKIKRGSQVVEDLLQSVTKGLQTIHEIQTELQNSEKENEGRLLLLQDRLERTASITGFQMIKEPPKSQQSPPATKKKKSSSSTRYEPTFRRFKSPNGCQVLVGRNRRDNEAICFQVARSEDIWMHSRGCPGAHVLVQVRRGSPRPTEDCMQFAANLAAFYSDFRTERKTPVTTAHAKHLSKPRGAPLGAVTIRQEMKTVIGRPADVSDELKIAREQSSGGVSNWDESTGSRSLGGKAKNKKWTREVDKKAIHKKRIERRAKKKRKGRHFTTADEE